MSEDELIKEATETPEWRAIPLIDRPLFVRGYVTGVKAKLSELNNLYKDLYEATKLIIWLRDELKCKGDWKSASALASRVNKFISTMNGEKECSKKV